MNKLKKFRPGVSGLGRGPVEGPQLSRAGKLGEIPLAQNLIGADCRRVCQRQASKPPRQGNAPALARVVKQKRYRQPGRAIT